MTRTEIAQALYDALAAGDAPTLGALLDPDFEGRTADGMPLGLGGRFVGAEDMQRHFWWRLGRHFRVRAFPEEFAEVEGGLVVTGRYRGSSRSGARELDAGFVHLLGFADQRISSLRQYTDTARWCAALDVELPVSPPSPEKQHLETIAFAVLDGVAHVVLDRPDVRNAIDLRLAQDWLQVARAIAGDPGIRAVLIRGNGPALTVGGDLAYMAEHGADDLPGLLRRMTTPFHEGFRVLSDVGVPVVTAAHGATAGGGLGFVYAADIVIAADDARFVTAFAALGLSGDGGGTWHLPRRIGPARAARVMLENQPLTAEAALELGLVSEVVPAADLVSRAEAVAVRLATGPTVAFGQMRRLLSQSSTSSLSAQLFAETEALAMCAETDDARSAITAFLAGERPRFEGR